MTTFTNNNQRRLTSERLESRTVLSGVTLLTHGFGGSVDGWVTEMANAILARAAGDAVMYVVEVTDPGHDEGPLAVVNTSRTGPALDAVDTNTPELMILLDWSDVAGSFSFGSYVRSTLDVAAAVAEALSTPGFLDELAVELPLHLVGHSRGGSLVGELSQQLGERGVWVDHVTTLDPHPVDGVRDPFAFDFGDAPMTAWQSVVFWDNYWRTDGDTSLDFTGESIAGTLDVQLLESAFDNFTGYANEHSDVHLWYHGTIDTTGLIDDGSASVSEDAGWYNGAMGPRTAIGYNFSRVGGAPRPAAGVLAGTVNGTAERTPITDHARDDWPSLLELHLATESTVTIGASLLVDYAWHQFEGSASLTFYLDTDSNPYNGTGLQLGDPRELTPTSAGLMRHEAETLDTIGATSGTYYLLAQISDSNLGRFLYDLDPFELVEPVNEPLVVTSFTATGTGFVAEFDRAVDSSPLNLFADEPDVILVGDSVGRVSGSLAIDSNSQRITFVKDNDLLAPDAYTVMLRSADDGFRDSGGGLLDGDGDGTPGGDWTTAFTVVPVTHTLFRIPSFVRGPGQPVNVPADSAAGIPLSVNEAMGIRSLQISVKYDSTVLAITDAALPAGAPAGSTITFDNTVPGMATLAIQSPADFGSGPRTLANLVAHVPDDAESSQYGRGQALELRNVTIGNANGEMFASFGSEAYHLVGYFGDVSGNRRVNASDAAQVARVAALLTNGFGGTPLVDPMLAGDITGNRRINAADASRVAQFAALVSVPEIPPLPATAQIRQDTFLVEPPVKAGARPLSPKKAPKKVTSDFTLGQQSDRIGEPKSHSQHRLSWQTLPTETDDDLDWLELSHEFSKDLEVVDTILTEL